MTSQTSQLAVARTLLSVTLAATLTVATIYAVLACGDVGMGIAGGPPIYADYGLEVAQAIAATSAVLVLSWITLTVDTRSSFIAESHWFAAVLSRFSSRV